MTSMVRSEFNKRMSARLFSRPSLVLSVSVLLVVSLCTGLAFHRDIIQWWILTFRAPQLERDLGFTADVRKHPSLADPRLMITNVRSGGIFDTSGIKRGWMPQKFVPPNTFDNLTPREFYELLQNHRGRSVTLDFYELPEGRRFEARGYGHKVTLTVPETSGPARLLR